MNKTELVSAIAKRTGLPKTEILKILNTFIDIVGEELCENELFQLVGFGKFTVSDVKSYYGRNPQNVNEVIKVPESKRVHFSAGSKLKKRIKDHTK